MPFSPMPESSRRMPMLTYAWIAAAILHVLLWATTLMQRAAFFLLAALIGPVDSQPLTLWTWFAGPLFLFTWLVEWRSGFRRSSLGYLVTTLVWGGLWVSLPHLQSWLVGETARAALATLALFVLPLGLSWTMMRRLTDADLDVRAA
jgi:hypothetical protein